MKKSPCSNCPRRKDSDPDEWPRQRRHELVAIIVGGFQMMACHKTKEDRPKPCAGYVAQVGMERIGLRLLSTKGLLNLDVYAPGAANPHETSGALLRAKGIDTEEINTVLSKTERQGHGTPKAQSASLEEEIARRTAPVEALLPKAPRLLILKTMLRAGGTCEFRYQ